jgi:hypothetical protein
MFLGIRVEVKSEWERNQGSSEKSVGVFWPG